MNYGIDEGHCLSGCDTGARSIVIEEVKNREIGAILRARIAQSGNVVTNCTINTATDTNASLSGRVSLANNAKVDAYVSIHLNAGGGEGVEILIHARGGKAEILANGVLAEMVKLGYKNRGVRVAKEYLGYNLFVLARTQAPAILIECGFVDSQADCNLFNAEKIGNAIANGLGVAQVVAPVPVKVSPVVSKPIIKPFAKGVLNKDLQIGLNSLGEGLVVDGIIGARSVQACYRHVIISGQRNLLVKWLQEFLCIENDGVYLGETANAIKNYQNKVGCIPDGIVGQVTYGKILGIK